MYKAAGGTLETSEDLGKINWGGVRGLDIVRESGDSGGVALTCHCLVG